MNLEAFSDKALQTMLEECLTNKGLTKRNGYIEKIQLQNLKSNINKIAQKYKNVTIDYEPWDTSKKLNQWFLDYNGNLKCGTNKQNPWYDTKTFDAILNLTIGNKNHVLFFILKGVERPGGHQKNVKEEIGRYTKLIQKNTNNNYHFFFILDGKYINQDTNKLDKTPKYDIATSKTIGKYIQKFINKNLI